jgi:hypothetical protein
MKRIVRLTESDLTRIVRRVVKESRLLKEGAGKTAFDIITAGMSVWDGTDEAEVKRGVFTIKSLPDYKECLALVKAEGYNTIMAYIATDMEYASGGYDKSQSASTYFPGQREQNGMLDQFSAHLRKFSGAETIVK